MDQCSIRTAGHVPAGRGFLRTVATARSLAWVLVAALTAACGKVPPITQADLVPVDLQSVSTWNPDLAGTVIGEAIGTGGTFTDCFGFIDSAANLGNPAQTRLEGWAWDTAAAGSFGNIVVTDRNGLIVGAGVTVVERADVAGAFPDKVRDSLVGFVAFSTPDAERLTVYGVNVANDTVCAVGSTG